MKTFNKSIAANQTKVQLSGEYGYRLVTEIHPTRKWIKVQGVEGSFQSEHIITYTNKQTVDMFPAVDDLYTTDACGSVYERGSDVNMFCGKLNGRTLKQFVKTLQS